MKARLLLITATAGLWAIAGSAATILTGPIVDPANDHTYYLLGQDTWSGAETTAEGLGGHLATVRSAAENQWIFNTFASYGGVNRLLWIGLNDVASPGTWQWASGAPATYINWAPGEPSYGAEKWVYMYPNGLQALEPVRVPGAWNDYTDTSTEFGGPPPDPNFPVTPIYAVAEVPEPGAVALMLLGAFILRGTLRRPATR